MKKVAFHSMDIEFDCQQCYNVELKRVKELDNIANHGRGFWSDKQHTRLATNNFRRHASKMTIVSKNHIDYEEHAVEEHPRGINGISLTCSVCGETTFNYIQVGITDL